MRHVYVYYRVQADRLDAAAERVDALLDALSGYCTAAPRRMRRCDDSTTWMEVYEGVVEYEAFCAAMDALATRLELETFMPAGRHLECFGDDTVR